jgi:hypothetical protein
MTSASKFFADGVYPPMTSSWPALTRIFIHASDRSPGSYFESRRFAQLWQNVLFDEFAPLDQGLPSASSDTISPSITVSSGILASASTMPGYLAAKSLSLRERR